MWVRADGAANITVAAQVANAGPDLLIPAQEGAAVSKTAAARPLNSENALAEAPDPSRAMKTNEPSSRTVALPKCRMLLKGQ